MTELATSLSMFLELWGMSWNVPTNHTVWFNIFSFGIRLSLLGPEELWMWISTFALMSHGPEEQEFSVFSLDWFLKIEPGNHEYFAMKMMGLSG